MTAPSGELRKTKRENLKDTNEAGRTFTEEANSKVRNFDTINLKFEPNFRSDTHYRSITLQ